MPDPSHILNWRRLDEKITTSGQLSESQLAEVRKLGVTHVINLGPHTHEQALPNEADIVQALGMEYIHIPVDFERPTETELSCFRAAIVELKDELVHVHCIYNARVTAFIYRLRTEVAGIDERSARDFMESVWRPGGVWALFIGDEERSTLPHEYAGIDY